MIKITREELKRFEGIANRIRTKEEQLAQLQSIGKDLSISISEKVQTSRKNTNEEKLIKKLDAIEVLQREINNLKTKQTEMLNLFDKLNGKMRLLMIYKYIDGMPWNAIGYRIDRSRTRMYQMHGIALNILLNENK